MLKFCTTVLFLLSSHHGISQTLLGWQKCYGGSQFDYPNHIIRNSNGGYLIIGSTNSLDGQVTGLHLGSSPNGNTGDAWVVSVDSMGIILWEKCFGGSDDESGNSIAHTNDGGFIICCFSSSNDGDVSGNHGISSDAWVVKLDSIGNLEWQRCYGGTKAELPFCIIQTFGGGYILCSYSQSIDGDVPGNYNPNPQSPSSTTADVWLLKIDSIGTIEWSQNYGAPGEDWPVKIVQTYDSGYAFVAMSEGGTGSVNCGHGSRDFWLGRTDKVGNLLWSKCFGGSDWDEPHSLKQTPDSGFVMIGQTLSHDGDVTINLDSLFYEIWVIKTDKSGMIEWQKTIGGSEGDYGTSVNVLNDSTYQISGTTASNDRDLHGNHGATDVFLARISNAGQIINVECFGSQGQEDLIDLIDEGNGIQIVLATSNVNGGQVSGNHGSIDNWLVKLYDPSAQEASIELLPVSGSCTLSNSEEVILQITNLGTQEFSNFQASYSINGTGPIVEIILDTIHPGDTLMYHFISRADFRIPGTYTLQANVIVSGDAHAFNNVSSIEVRSIAHEIVPMSMGFEDNEYFGAYKSVDLDADGRSGGLDKFYPKNGNQCYVFASSYTMTPNNWLWSPCIDLNSTANYEVSGWLKEYSVSNPYNLEVYINSSPDANGGQLLGSIPAPSDTSYHHFRLPLNVPQSGTFYVGLRAYSSNYAVALFIDDFVVDLSSGIQGQKEIEKYTLYPNPAGGFVTILGELQGKHIRIYDLPGKLIYDHILSENKKEISLKGMSAGMYIVSIDEKVRIKLLKE